MTVQDRVKIFRSKLGLTQKEISDKIGVKPSFYSDIENGRRPVTKKFADKLKLVFNLSTLWLEKGEGEMHPKIVPFSVPEHGIEEGHIWGMFGKSYIPYYMYNSLSDKQLDIELSAEIQELKSVFEDYKKFTKAIHSINAPDFIREKFPIPGELEGFEGDFSKYRKKIEDEFLENHSHMQDQRHIKILKIIDLYQSDTAHWRNMISQLIDYFDRYSDFFFDDKSIKD